MSVLFKLLNMADNTELDKLSRQQINSCYVRRKRQLRKELSDVEIDNLTFTFRGLCNLLGVDERQQAFMLSCGFDVDDVLGFETEDVLESEQGLNSVLFDKVLALINFAKDELMGFVENGFSRYVPNVSKPDKAGEITTSNKSRMIQALQNKDTQPNQTINKATFPKIIYPSNIMNEDINLSVGRTGIIIDDLKQGRLDTILGGCEDIPITLTKSIYDGDVLITKAIKISDREKAEKYAIYGGFKRPIMSSLMVIPS